MTEHIQINDVSPRIQYVADGIQSAFTFPFALFKAADLSVWVNGVQQSSGFTVSGVGISSGGTVLFASPPAADAKVTLIRNLSLNRTSDYQTDGLIRAKTLNDELDYQVAALQQVAEEVSRAVIRSAMSSNTADLTLPEPVAGRSLKWNSSALGLVNSDADPDQVVARVTADAAQVAADRASVMAALSASLAAQSGAETAAAAAATAAGTVTLPSADGHATHYLRQNATQTGFEYRTPAQVLADIGGQSSTDVPNAVSLLLNQQALTNLRLMLATSVGTGALVQGKQWELFTDEWGATSTNETYASGSPGYYANPGTTTIIPASGNWTGAGTWSYGAGTVSNASVVDAATQLSSVSMIADFEFTGTVTTGSHYGSGVFLAANAGSFDTASGNGGGSAALGALYEYYRPTGALKYNGTTVATVSIADGDVLTWKRVGSTITFLKNGSLAHTFATTNSAPLRPFIGRANSGGTVTVSGISVILPGSAADMTLLPPAAVSVSSVPSYVDAYVLWKDDSGSAVLGTDLVVELSRDGGTTWTAATLTTLLGTGGFDGTYSVLRARANVSGQPSGTALTCRIKTLNTKAQRIAAPAIYAE